jgi:dolichol-phosphate mannosyltransferase
MYELMSEVGFVRVLALYNDFVYSPLREPLIWTFRNLSTVLENTPVLRTFAGSILIRGQKPAGDSHAETPSLCEHPVFRDAVSVVVPCRNEEANVRPIVERLLALYGEYIREIILVDDSSQDGTAAEMRALAREYPVVRTIFRSPPNGVGRALADGFRAASGRFLLTMDCDFVRLLPEMRDLFDAAADGCDVVVGSRFSRHSVLLNYPLNKIIANRGFHALAQLVFRRHFRDLTNNLKLLSRRAFECLELHEPGFAANAETGLEPLLMGFTVREVPISWVNRTPGMGSSSFRLAQVGGGYWRVLARLAVETRFGTRPLRRGTGQPRFREVGVAST